MTTCLRVSEAFIPGSYISRVDLHTTDLYLQSTDSSLSHVCRHCCAENNKSMNSLPWAQEAVGQGEKAPHQFEIRDGGVPSNRR